MNEVISMDLPKSIAFEIKVLATLLKRNLDAGRDDTGKESLTGMQGWVLGYLKGNTERDIFQRDLEKEFNIRRATVSGVLQLMERNGLIVREPVEHDARLKKISLTEKGILLHEQN